VHVYWANINELHMPLQKCINNLEKNKNISKIDERKWGMNRRTIQ
jgi:hypothetical protein